MSTKGKGQKPVEAPSHREPVNQSDEEKKTLRFIDEKAKELSGGDEALFFHHQALLEGQYRIYCGSGREGLDQWRRSQRRPQYNAAEQSVIEGWRKYLENTVRIPAHKIATRTHVCPSDAIHESTLYLPKEQQADDYAINRALILSHCRWAKNEEEVARLLEERADSIRTFAAQGDIAFFRSLGNVLKKRRHSSLRAFNYAHAMLAHWLVSFLWLMPEVMAAEWLAVRFGEKLSKSEEIDKALRHFKKAKAEYRLRAHSPSLIELKDGKMAWRPEADSLSAQ